MEGPHGLPMEARFHGNFFERMSLAGIEPVGFRVKSDLRNHQAIVQPRLYDSEKAAKAPGLPSSNGT
jgi:hypothetical protein